MRWNGNWRIDNMEEKNQKLFNHDQVHKALMFCFDVLDRTHEPFILLDEVANRVNNNYENLDGIDRIIIALNKGSYSGYVADTIDMLIPGATKFDNKIMFDVEGVPVIIKILQKNWKVLQNPDRRFYSVEEFWIPNPFPIYWRQRKFI